MKYQFMVHTFGCKVNTYDSGLLQKRLGQNGHVWNIEEPQVHILNTCAVTSEATKEAIKQVRRLRAKNPSSTIVLTGCAAQVDGASLDDLPGVDLVVANSHKGQLENILDAYFKGDRTQKIFRSNIFRKEDLEAGGGLELEHTRTFLKIQDGCNSFCTFCVIPYARGKSRSLPIRDLLEKIREIEAKGIQEVVLTGVHIGDYEDGERGLAELVEAILAETQIARLRLSSLEPIELNDRLLATFQDSRMCRHFHMSIQSSNTRVLQAMKRKYGQNEVESSLYRIQESVPGAFVGMDVIAGFPGETDEEFEDTYQSLARIPWTRLHVFPYSERPGTRAALLPDSVSRERRMHRAAQLRTLSQNRYQEHAHRQIGSEQDILILHKPAKGADGLSRSYWPVRLLNLDDRVSLAGKEVKVRIEKYEAATAHRMDGVLLGRLQNKNEEARASH